MTASRPKGRRGSIRWIVAGIILLALSVIIGILFRSSHSFHFLDRMPLKSKDIVLLGDSHFEYFDAAAMLNDKRIRNKGVSGQTSAEMLGRVDEIAHARPRKVLLIAGANDAFRGRSLQDYLRDMEMLIDRLLAGAQEVVVLSIPPTTDPQLQRRFNEFNTALQELCAGTGTTFVDLMPALEVNGLLDAAYTYDGVHLNEEGYRQLLPLLKPHIRR